MNPICYNHSEYIVYAKPWIQYAKWWRVNGVQKPPRDITNPVVCETSNSHQSKLQEHLTKLNHPHRWTIMTLFEWSTHLDSSYSLKHAYFWESLVSSWKEINKWWIQKLQLEACSNMHLYITRMLNQQQPNTKS